MWLYLWGGTTSMPHCRSYRQPGLATKANSDQLLDARHQNHALDLVASTRRTMVEDLIEGPV